MYCTLRSLLSIEQRAGEAGRCAPAPSDDEDEIVRAQRRRTDASGTASSAATTVTQHAPQATNDEPAEEGSELPENDRLGRLPENGETNTEEGRPQSQQREAGTARASARIRRGQTTKDTTEATHGRVRREREPRPRGETEAGDADRSNDRGEGRARTIRMARQWAAAHERRTESDLEQYRLEK